MKRPRFQYHLSTAIILMFVAGGLMWANTHQTFRPYTFDGFWNVVPSQPPNWQAVQGWPCTYRSALWSRYEKDLFGLEPENYEHPPEHLLGPLVADISVAVAALLATGVLCEWRIRRKERPHD